MGSICCRMLQRRMLESEGTQSNGYVNEAHSYTEHDQSISQTVKISELKNEDFRITEQESQTDSQDVYNTTEKTKTDITDDTVSKLSSTPASTYLTLNLYPIGEEIIEQNSKTESDSTLLSNNSSGFDQDSNFKRNSEELESAQDEFYDCTSENNSLTESAIHNVSIKHGDDMMDFISVAPASDDQGHILNSDDYLSNHLFREPSVRSDDSSIVAQLIIKHSIRCMKRGSTNKHIRDGSQAEDDDMDPDVAEALAALAAAIAGEEFEEDPFGG
ncbi:Hypothetical predicted protein [Pelobates cultripes]|uniref:Uncharacterized protein n=1 Tax=Pelobates cultripes TaxID=61616 RepID=A0AAD1SEI4_PELCU|nr:Hypothetical predicted protein [Pelobates cultripes]